MKWLLVEAAAAPCVMRTQLDRAVSVIKSLAGPVPGRQLNGETTQTAMFPYTEHYRALFTYKKVRLTKYYSCLRLRLLANMRF